MNSQQAIPTEYRGHRFRSRLEARWACFFDNCGWPWEYEPIDLNGYIPDFVLPFESGPIIAEVKPVLYAETFRDHWEKIKNSTWKNEVLILGARIFESYGNASIGSHSERDSQSNWLNDGEPIFQTCRKCGRISFFNSIYSYHCRVSGCYDGNGYLDPWPYEKVRQLFADAGNVVQYAT